MPAFGRGPGQDQQHVQPGSRHYLPPTLGHAGTGAGQTRARPEPAALPCRGKRGDELRPASVSGQAR